MTKREDKIDSQAVGVIDSKEVVLAGDEISKERLEELKAKYKEVPIKVTDGEYKSSFDVVIPKGLPVVCQWIKNKGDSADIEIARGQMLGYRFDLPEELYNANKNHSDSPFSANRVKSNTIERGSVILAWRWKSEEASIMANKEKELRARNADKQGARTSSGKYTERGDGISLVSDTTSDSDAAGKEAARAQAIIDAMSLQKQE